MKPAPSPMHILLLSSTYNGLTQLTYTELRERGYRVSVATGAKPKEMSRVVDRLRPDLVLCPMLQQKIPRGVWQRVPCLVVHPGIVGDRGPNALDWAIVDGEQEWGVTVLQAAQSVDAGAVWASARCPLRSGTKSSLYRDELSGAAISAILRAVRRFEGGHFAPAPVTYSDKHVHGRYRPFMPPARRAINWSEDTVGTIVRKIRSADSSPGVLDDLGGQAVYLYGAHGEARLLGRPGALIAQRHGAVCRAAVDGAVWLTHLRRADDPEAFKLPATLVLSNQLKNVPTVELALDAATTWATYRDVWYEERGAVGYLNFDFYNGAMGTDACIRLMNAVRFARRRPIKILVLCGGRDFWSNGIDLNQIEAALDPAAESWRNISAMNDLVRSIVMARQQVTIAALHGSAGAGGVMLALAADYVLARDGIVLNPHYRGMGGLYGSEYWTFLLPKRVGPETALKLSQACLPVGTAEASRLGLIDDVILFDGSLSEGHAADGFDSFRAQVARFAQTCADQPRRPSALAAALAGRSDDEVETLLERFSAAELMMMQKNFWGSDRSYHDARRAFVRKLPQPLIVRPASTRASAGSFRAGRGGRSMAACWSCPSGDAALPEVPRRGP